MYIHIGHPPDSGCGVCLVRTQLPWHRKWFVATVSCRMSLSQELGWPKIKKCLDSYFSQEQLHEFPVLSHVPQHFPAIFPVVFITSIIFLQRHVRPGAYSGDRQGAPKGCFMGIDESYGCHHHFQCEIIGMVYTVYTTYLYLFMVIWGLVYNYCFTHIKVNHGTSQISDFNPEYIYIYIKSSGGVWT